MSLLLAAALIVVVFVCALAAYSLTQVALLGWSIQA